MTEESLIESGQLWRHVKTGGLYVVVDATGTMKSTLERMVLYENQKTGKRWIRPYSEFNDGRFKLIYR